MIELHEVELAVVKPALPFVLVYPFFRAAGGEVHTLALYRGTAVVIVVTHHRWHDNLHHSVVLDMVGVIRQLMQQSHLTTGTPLFHLLARRGMVGAVLQHLMQRLEKLVTMLVKQSDTSVATLALTGTAVGLYKIRHLIDLLNAQLAVLAAKPCLTLIGQLLFCHSLYNIVPIAILPFLHSTHGLLHFLATELSVYAYNCIAYLHSGTLLPPDVPGDSYPMPFIFALSDRKILHRDRSNRETSSGNPGLQSVFLFLSAEFQASPDVVIRVTEPVIRVRIRETALRTVIRVTANNEELTTGSSPVAVAVVSSIATTYDLSNHIPVLSEFHC